MLSTFSALGSSKRSVRTAELSNTVFGNLCFLSAPVFYSVFHQLLSGSLLSEFQPEDTSEFADRFPGDRLQDDVMRVFIDVDLNPCSLFDAQLPSN
jgi:hypothetical protein